MGAKGAGDIKFRPFFFHCMSTGTWAQTKDLDRGSQMPWLRLWVYYSLLHRPNINLRPGGIKLGIPK